MPNWACGTVSVQGNKEGILKFTDRFIYEGDLCEAETKADRYFAQSLTNVVRSKIVKEIEELFSKGSSNKSGTYDLPVEFAWSAHSCIINGYPQQTPEECITLSDACKLDGVSVKINTEECGMCFEEFIYCDSDGVLIDEYKDMPLYKCSHCGCVMAVSSHYDPENYECCDCGESELVLKSPKVGENGTEVA